jgi:anionic cell wall polymer biosynthesis LytR-Cps2A-Psr (LCP) family protein
MKKFSYISKLKLAVFVSCIISGTATYILLSLAANAGRKQALLKSVPSDYARYASMGYAYETVSNKKNIIISVTDEEELARLQLWTFDEDKKTLDILEIPPQTLLSADNFEGTVSQAHESGVYRDIISRSVMLDICGSFEMDTEALSHIAAALGGIEIKLSEPVEIGENTLAKGKRTAAGSVAGIIASDREAYTSGSRERAGLFIQITASIIRSMDDRGAVEWFTALMDIITNEIKGDMSITKLMELVNLSNRIKIDDVNIMLLPGQTSQNGFYLAETDKAAKLLNERFRVKGSTFEADKLGFAIADGVKEQYPSQKTKIKEILK